MCHLLVSFILNVKISVKANNKFKRLVLGKEVRLRGAYVIKAERIEKDAMVKSPMSVLTMMKRWVKTQVMVAR